MNLVYGEIVEISSDDGLPMGKVRFHGVTRKIPLGLLTGASRGDRVLVCDGVAIGKVAAPCSTEETNVSGDSREAH
jgi:hydrogenase maturation factor